MKTRLSLFLFFSCLFLTSMMQFRCTPVAENQEHSTTDGGQERVSEAKNESFSTDVHPCRTTPVIRHEQWQMVSLAKDPFKSLRPDFAGCRQRGWKLEDGLLEVDTNICGFVTLEQPLLSDLQKGTRLRIVFWHLDLVADSPSRGQAILQLGSQKVWTWETLIPAKAELFEQVIQLKSSFSKGTRVLFHLNNHGSNNYRLLSIKRDC